MDARQLALVDSLSVGTTRLNDPLANKGTAFTARERADLGIDGLLPPRVEALDEQAARALDNVHERSTPLEKYRYLSGIHAENATLFYRLVLDHMEEMLPFVYTPTVGQACLDWSRIYERPRGLYISAAQHSGRIVQLLRNWPNDDVGMIVVTDGGRILGLGDLGANGMGIPIGKLSLYTACAGVPPARCLPITLDVGTDSESVRNDTHYLGERQPRLTGGPYDRFIDEFVSATQTVFPHAIVQFEDFNNRSAFALLDRHRDRICCFNDDIQGTGAMGLAGLHAAGRLVNRPLIEQRILFAGAGEACLGIGALVIRAMQRDGLSEDEAHQRCLFLDSQGVVTTQRPGLALHKRPFAQSCPPQVDLVGAIEGFKPTTLIGACAQAGLFTQQVLQTMARLNERPIVFALSNPTSKAECTAEQAYTSTSGRAIFASGSPFDPVTVDGRECVPAQANNCHVFPGVGLGLLVSRARRVTDDMFLAAAAALTRQVSDADLAQGRVFPRTSHLRQVALAVAVAVATVAHDSGVASRPRPTDLTDDTARSMYSPHYS